jgi:hypothetical protein
MALEVAASVLLWWACVCAARQGVLVSASSVVVRGWLWSRHIPREAILGVTDWPAIRWSSNRRDRWTPLHAFSRPGIGPNFNDLDRDNLAQLRHLLTDG